MVNDKDKDVLVEWAAHEALKDKATASGLPHAESLAEIIAAPPHTLSFVGNGSDWPELPTVRLLCPEEGHRLNYSGAWTFHPNQIPPPMTARFAPPLAHLASREIGPARYTCGSCGHHFFMGLRFDFGGASFSVHKLGQTPKFSIAVGPGVNRIARGAAWDFYRKGREAESLGMGVAAFAYYRRVVEHSRDALASRLVLLAKESGETETVAHLERAKAETQFTQSLDLLAGHLPKSLVGNGDNPLKLLHAVFSRGVHNKSDSDCLTLATQTRSVLEDLMRQLEELIEHGREAKEARKVLREYLDIDNAGTEQPDGD